MRNLPFHRGPRYLFACLALVAVGALACTSDSVDPRGFPRGTSGVTLPFTMYGQNISVTVEDVRIKDRAYYRDTNGVTYVVQPSKPGNKIVTVLTHLRNHNAAKLLIDINSEAFVLRDTKDVEYPPIDPFADPVLAPNVPRGELVLDVMWGPNEFLQGYGVIAWSMFDMPATPPPMELRWAAVDVIFVRFLTRPT